MFLVLLVYVNSWSRQGYKIFMQDTAGYVKLFAQTVIVVNFTRTE